MMTDQGDAGEDDNSTEKGGDDSHLHEDQKSPAAGKASDKDSSQILKEAAAQVKGSEE